ncbi:golvesin C-terminal-like domain-containing protein [Streptomyces halobius]|uniref:GDSL-type esterase/lipase family protein n=1 Tax=Streptomyces halobius TaxID=2879846 RepID=A0ABY4MGS4_9ACTN|nr:GDSL-type esterase/lipase family protein [Streptomyces halobius]UQA96708.1 GDSL-type esterase/lipase family protein [Streptomyces halobius]
MALTTTLIGTAQADEPKPPKDAAQGWDTQEQKKRNPPKPASIPGKERSTVLGKDYKSSKDTAVTTSGDGSGFHLLAADAKDGYTFTTVATLREDGFASDTWIGNHCVTASGKYAAVAYAPRMFTNKPELMVRGAFTALVNLGSGKVTKLPFSASLAYFSPGCGNSDDVVFSQLTHDGDKEQKTRLITVDAATGKEKYKSTHRGQVTSAVPTSNGIVAAHGNEQVRINKAKEAELARTRTVPFEIKADAEGGVTFIDRDLDKSAKKTPKSYAQHLGAQKVKAGKKTKPATLAEGSLEAWDLARSSRGEVFITGKATSKAKAEHVHNPGKITKGALISSHGASALTTAWADGKTTVIDPEDADSSRTVRTTLRVLGTGKTATLDVAPGADRIGGSTAAGQGAAKSPVLPGGKKSLKGSAGSGMSTQTVRTQATAGWEPKPGSPNSPIEGASERTCSVERNNPMLQAFQPTPRQVEWAADQAVVNKLDFYRKAGWKKNDIGGYSPGGLFPAPVLAGDPSGALESEDGANDKWHIPAQVLLGITAQESNMWQATRFAVPGVTANSLIGNYYGIDYSPSGSQTDPWHINWFDADCGYGITQVTDGMRLPGRDQTTTSQLAQNAVAVDYTANIAAGVQILSEKWDQTYKAGMKVNGGHPQWIENWFYALWAYNSGFWDKDPDGGTAHTGLGWTNNPADPLWKANRTPFLENADGENDYSHAAHPQDWPYQEKVIGWAARPISALFAPGDFQAGYRPAWWNSESNRANAKPPVDLFCAASNNCDPSKIGDNDSNDPGQGACTLDARAKGDHQLHCWVNQPAQWKDCDTFAQCGNAVHRFNTSYPEQPDGTAYPPKCSTGLPSGSLVVDNLPNGSQPAGSAGRSCGTVSSNGTFKFTYAPWDSLMQDDDGITHTVTTYPGKIDTHQVGAGYGNHFYFTHTRNPQPGTPDAKRMFITGKWTLNQSNIGWARVFVHMPDHGAHTRQAAYEVGGSNSTSTTRVVPQRTRENRWVSLGAFNFAGTPTVSLSNFTGDGTGSEDIAWDAVAFQKLPGKPRHQIVSMGDSFSSGASEGNADYFPETNYRNKNSEFTRNACHRSYKAWSRQAKAPGFSSSIGEMEDLYNPNMDHHLIACSGARTQNVLDTPQGNSGELPQMQQGYLDQNTTLVTMSIGGNDSLFATVIQACLVGLATGNCKNSVLTADHVRGEPAGKYDGQVGKPFEVAVPELMQKVVRPDIVKTIKAIHEKAPNAKIELMGYPRLIEGDGDCLRKLGIAGLSKESAAWLATVADDLTVQMDAAAADARPSGIDVRFTNPMSEFAGKGICGDPESIHGLVVKLTDSDNPAIDWPILNIYGLSAQSFHPKISGARLYANALEGTMDGWGL